MRYAKVVGHARPPEKLSPNDAGVTLFSAEDFKVEYGEVHAYRTGLVLEIPQGKLGFLKERGTCVVAGSLLTPNDVGEVRVNLLNNHRNAYEVKAGMPVCQLVILEDETDEDFEEFEKTSLVAEMNTNKDKVAAAAKEKK